jgi:hypothetical protein
MKRAKTITYGVFSSNLEKEVHSNARVFQKDVSGENKDFITLMKGRGHSVEEPLDESSNEQIRLNLSTKTLGSKKYSYADIPVSCNRAMRARRVKGIVQRDWKSNFAKSISLKHIHTAFLEQSKNWRSIAIGHIQDLLILCEAFLNKVSISACERVQNVEVLREQLLRPGIKRVKVKAEAKLEEILQPFEKSPALQYNPEFDRPWEHSRSKLQAESRMILEGVSDRENQIASTMVELTDMYYEVSYNISPTAYASFPSQECYTPDF